MNTRQGINLLLLPYLILFSAPVLYSFQEKYRNDHCEHLCRQTIRHHIAREHTPNHLHAIQVHRNLRVGSDRLHDNYVNKKYF